MKKNIIMIAAVTGVACTCLLASGCTAHKEAVKDTATFILSMNSPVERGLAYVAVAIVIAGVMNSVFRR